MALPLRYFNPDFANQFGLNEAIMFQHLKVIVPNTYDWIKQSYSEFKMDLPFWSELTISRTLKSLEKRTFIESKVRNSNKYDRVKSYRIIEGLS